MAIAGRVAIVPKGDWSANATYKRLDAVTYNNTLYFAKKNVPAGTVTSNTEYWTKSIVGSAVTVDDALSSTSTNPVQNKVVTSNLTDIRKETTVNLLKPTFETVTQNGVTCTNNGDGTYTLNGTATVVPTFFIVDKLTVNKGSYKVTRISNSNSSASCSLRSKDGNDILADQDGIAEILENTEVWFYIRIGDKAPLSNVVVKPMLTTNLSATYDDFVPYTGDTGKLNGDVAELKKTINGALPAANIVNDQTTTEEGFALDARQANPNIDGSLAKQISDLNGSLNSKKIPSFGIENIFTGNPFCIVNNGSDVISVQTNWDIDNGGYRVKNIKYPAGTTTNLTVSLSLPANSIVIVDVNTLNGENIDIQGSLIRSNFTSSPKNWNLSIKFTGRTNQILTDIRYMPLVIHLG